MGTCRPVFSDVAHGKVEGGRTILYTVYCIANWRAWLPRGLGGGGGGVGGFRRSPSKLSMKTKAII